jgi:hypothetical protein
MVPHESIDVFVAVSMVPTVLDCARPTATVSTVLQRLVCNGYAVVDSEGFYLVIYFLLQVDCILFRVII